MELLLGAALVAYVITKMVTTHRVEHEYAKQGMTPPRMQAKLDRIAAGSTERPPARPGASGYLRELWHDAWDDATDRHKRIRAAKKAGHHPTVRQRVAGWWRWAKTPVGDPPDKPAGRPAVSPGTAVASPTGLPDGTWTLDQNGQRVPLAPPAEPPAPPAAPTPAPDPDTATDPLNLQPRVDTDAGTDTEPEGNTTMGDTDTTAAGAAATEVNTNEDARQAFTRMKKAAEQAADALAVLERARAEIAAAALALKDGMSAKKFDHGATAAANEAVDTIDVGTIANWSEPVDNVIAAAEAGLEHLSKYHDSEAQVAQEGIDPTVLASTSA